MAQDSLGRTYVLPRSRSDATDDSRARGTELARRARAVNADITRHEQRARALRRQRDRLIEDAARLGITRRGLTGLVGVSRRTVDQAITKTRAR